MSELKEIFLVMNKKTHIVVDEKLKYRMKIAAAKENMTLQEWTAKALKEILKGKK